MDWLNDCDDTDIYFKAAEYAYNIEPSYESAIGTAQKYYKDGKVAESVQYFDKALELCPTDQTKAAIALKIANAVSKTGDSAKAFSYLDKAVQYNAGITGKAHLVRAQILASSKNFSEANLVLYESCSGGRQHLRFCQSSEREDSGSTA